MTEGMGLWWAGIPRSGRREMFQSISKVWSKAGGYSVTEVRGEWLAGVPRSGRREMFWKHKPGL
jgi:hypothetical protein